MTEKQLYSLVSPFPHPKKLSAPSTYRTRSAIKNPYVPLSQGWITIGIVAPLFPLITI